jgi:hypothetical protein
MLLLLTLSDTFLIPNFPEYNIVDVPLPDYLIPDNLAHTPEVLNYTRQYLNYLYQQHADKSEYDELTQILIDEGQRQMLNSTILAIFPFVSFSIFILTSYLNPNWNGGRRKRWLTERLPVALTILGMFGILFFFMELQVSGAKTIRLVEM